MQLSATVCHSESAKKALPETQMLCNALRSLERFCRSMMERLMELGQECYRVSE